MPFVGEPRPGHGAPRWSFAPIAPDRAGGEGGRSERTRLLDRGHLERARTERPWPRMTSAECRQPPVTTTRAAGPTTSSIARCSAERFVGRGGHRRRATGAAATVRALGAAASSSATSAGSTPRRSSARSWASPPSVPPSRLQWPGSMLGSVVMPAAAEPRDVGAGGHRRHGAHQRLGRARRIQFVPLAASRGRRARRLGGRGRPASAPRPAGAGWPPSRRDRSDGRARRDERWHQPARRARSTPARRPTSRGRPRRASPCAPPRDSSMTASPPSRRTIQPPTSKRVVARRLRGHVAQQPAVLGQRELAPQWLSRDAAEGRRPRCVAARSATSAPSRSSCQAMTGASGRSRRVDEHAGLPHAGDPDRRDRQARRPSAAALSASKALRHNASASIWMPSGPLLPRRGGAAGAEDDPVGAVHHGLARRRPDVEAPAELPPSPLLAADWVCHGYGCV